MTTQSSRSSSGCELHVINLPKSINLLFIDIDDDLVNLSIYFIYIDQKMINRRVSIDPLEVLQFECCKTVSKLLRTGRLRG
jgi:hypothetical protein